MSHLHSDRLAALVDESATAAEAAHLAGCEACSHERAVYQNLASLARIESPQIGVPITRWENIAPVLAAEGIIHHGRAVAGGRWARRSGGAWRQAAAAIIFVAGGVVAGRYSAGASLVPAARGPSAVAPVAATTPASVTTFASIQDARAVQRQSQLLYQSATDFLAQRDSTTRAPDTPAGMRTRLAALDRTRQVMGEALQNSPYDPVINDYYISTSGQREATLQQLNTVMPASMRITSY